MLKFLACNIDITDVFKSVILATLKSSKTKALTKAYTMILDNLDDSHDPPPRTLGPISSILKRRLPLRLVLEVFLFLVSVVCSLVFFSLYFLWEAYRDFFHAFLSLYIFVRSLTWRARHSQPLFTTRICFLCNQRAFARLVIRRAVEMKNPRFVGCSWFIGLIGLGFGFTQNKSTSTQVRCIRTPRVLTRL